MAKPFLTYPQQLNNLTARKGLIINDASMAETALHQVGYFSLIGGYKTPFINPMTRIYKPGTSFDDVLALYEFDKDLRHLVFKYICEIESNIRQLCSYSFCQKYGENQSTYLSANSFNVTKKTYKHIQKLIQMLDYQANINTDHKYIVHQRKTYQNVPLWVVMNTLTFGQLAHFYSFLPSSIQVVVSKDFANVNERELERYLDILTLFRNVCAHNERLYNFRINSREFPDKTLHNKLNIPKINNTYTQGKKDLFSLVIAFRYLLPANSFVAFKKDLSKIINSYHKKSSAIGQNDLLSIMGFPTNWNNITRYKM